MRIAAVTPTLSNAGGGVSLSVDALYREIEAAGDAKVVVFANGLGAGDERAGGAESRRYASAPGLVAKLARRNRFDVIHTHGLWQSPSIAAAALSLVKATPHVVSPHGMLDRWALSHSRGKKRLARFLYEGRNIGSASCVHALTEAEADAARAWGYAGPIAVIPNGVAPPAAAPAKEASEKSSGQRILLYLGRLHPKKGIDLLVDAWGDALAGAGAQAKTWRLRIAGWDDGGCRAALERQVSMRGLGETISFVGPAFGERKAQEFRRAAAFILPSLSEGLPVAVLEAWSYSLPVLMTDECNLGIGFARDAAIRIKPERADIATAIGRMMVSSAEDRAATGSRGRELVEAEFAWPKIAQRHIATYTWLLGGGPAPAWVRTT